MAEVFKSPHDVMGNRNSLGFYSPPPSGSYPNMKRSRAVKSAEFDNKRRRRTTDDFLTFCKMILDYENYEQIRSQNMRLRHSSSPMGSTGSSNESWPSSKDEDSEVYSHQNAKHAKTSDSSEPDDVEEPNESWNEVSCYCGKPFAGRPMVECSKCLTWLHLKCAGLRRNNIPDTWYCSKCKNSKKSDINITNTNNSKTISGSRKRKSTKVIQQKSTSNSKKKSISSSDVDVDLPIAAAPSTSISPITTTKNKGSEVTNTTVPSHNLALTSTTSSNNTSKETSERRKS